MRIAYLECFAGISGDMFLGALLDAGVPATTLQEATAALNIGATLRIEKVDRSGITSTKVHVLEEGRPAEAHQPTHEHTKPLEQQHTHNIQRQPQTQHLHKTGHPHTHEHSHQPHTHEHTHGRSLTVIRDLIRGASLAEPVKDFAIRTFELLGASEGKIHNVPVDQIHFHEVGAVDAIVDIVAASAGIHHLQLEALSETGVPLRWHSSPLNVGGGMVECAHGNFPVPAPATADLLRGLPTYSAHIEKELVTPTGAALIRALAPGFGPQPAMSVTHIGYGAGTRNPQDFPNVLRLSLGEASNIVIPTRGGTTQVPVISTKGGTTQNPVLSTGGGAAERPLYLEGEATHAPHTDTVTVLETALDDLNPQIIAHVTEQALNLGALDVMTTPVGMKKGRPGTLITILTDAAHSPALERLLLRETSTLGIRIHQQRRICLARHHHSVSTPFGEIRIKIGSFDSEAVNATPEFEDCRAAAAAANVPVKQVIQAAVAAYINGANQPAPDPAAAPDSNSTPPVAQ